MDFLLVLIGLLILVVPGIFSERYRKNDEPDWDIEPSTKIACPSCREPLSLSQMLDAAIFFDPSAVVFDCPHCKDRVYFAPFDKRIDVGVLGASPVLNPLPIMSYTYPTEALATFEIEGEALKAQIGSQEWAIPNLDTWRKTK